MLPYDIFFQVLPSAIKRLKSLDIRGRPKNLQDITVQLSHPAPLLESFSICGNYQHPEQPSALPSAIFNGDLSSLRKLCLEYVRTELPWRNAVNLTSLALVHVLPREAPAKQLIDFLESAPQLREVNLCLETTTSGVQDGRLVSLACLKRMEIICDNPSTLLNHLLIPAGAELTMRGDRFIPLIKDYLPERSRDNLRNLPNFTAIRLSDGSSWHIALSGPNGKVEISAGIPQLGETHWALKNIVQFDTSKIEQLRIDYNDSPCVDLLHQVLPPMKDLRTLTLYACYSLRILIDILNPNMSSSGVVVCPKLEDLVIEDQEVPPIKDIISMAAVRASRGAKLKSVRIACPYQVAEFDLSELRKHVSQVECFGFSRDDDYSDEEY